MSILEVDDLSISFNQYTKGLKQQKLEVISALDVRLEQGDILAVVGASGSGKSLLAHAILGILPSNASMKGTIKFRNEILTPKKQAKLRGKQISLIPQSVNFLNPLMYAGKQVQSSVKEGNARTVTQKIFEQLHLNKDVEKKYPFELSGGMARRVLLSTAILSDAELIIADEPTPGLDPAVIQEALKNFTTLADNGHTIMLITHDIESALTIANKIAVFYEGTTVEIASSNDFTGRGEALRHPYTKALWRALPQNDFTPIPSSQPSPDERSLGCVYATQCPYSTTECMHEQPKMRAHRGGMVRCIHAT